MKSDIEKCFEGLGSPYRYKTFQFGNGFRDHNALTQL